MIELINATTGTKMWVADERKDEYLRAGHKLALKESEKPIETEEAIEPIKKAGRKKKK